MQDTTLYQYLLGLKLPWTVSRVQLNITGQCEDVWAKYPVDAVWACPHCTKTLPLCDHADVRTSAPSQQLPVPDPPARADSTGVLRGTRSGPGYGVDRAEPRS